MTEYKIKIVDDKTNYIAANHKNKELLVSNDIKTAWTEDGKLHATFQNSEQSEPAFMDMVRDLCGKPYTPDNSDCSITIDDISKFHYCKRENDEYKLFGGGVTFKGTQGDDKLVMYECENSNVDLGDGNDSVRIEGAKSGGFLADFKNNKINTGNGNDTVTINGNFNKFTDNKINLGKGNDKFIAEINTDDDANITTASDYDKMETKYARNVLESSIQVTDGKRGFFEKDVIESKTYSSNKITVLGDLPQTVTAKPQPKRPVIVQKETPTSVGNKTTQTQKETTTKQSKEKITIENCTARYCASSALIWAGRKEGPEGLVNALNDYIELMKK